MVTEDKVGVLAELWIEFRFDEDFKKFIEYNDTGLPLAFFKANGLVNDLTPMGEQFIEESFDMLCETLEITEEEIDSVLPDKNLGSILLFAYNKKQANGQAGE